MTIEEQLAIFDAYAARGYEVALDVLARAHHRILLAARERLEAGYAEYGDRLFEADTAGILEEMVEEFADAVVYSTVRLWLLENH